MYSAGWGITAIFVLWFVVKKNRTQGAWLYALMLSCLVLGSSPMIQSILSPFLNGLFGSVADTVLGQSIGGVIGVYSAAVVIPCLIAIIAVWADGQIGKIERWILVASCMVLGSTVLVTAWLPPVLNGAFDMLLGMFQ